MQIYYDMESGNILYTLSTQAGTARLPGGTFIEVPEQDIGNLADAKVIEGALVLPSAEVVLNRQRDGWVVSQAQIRIALLTMGLLAQVTAIAQSDPAAFIVWEYADEIRRNNDLITVLGTDFTPNQIDDIFLFAMGLTL